MRAGLLASTMAIVVGATSVVHASPGLAIRVFDDGVATGLFASSPSGNALSLFGSTTDFSVVSAFSTGFPAVPQPAFSAQSTTVSALTGGLHTIRIEFTQTDISSASAGGLVAQLASTFTDNFLIGDGINTLTISNYADALDTAFGTTTFLGSLTDSSVSGPTGTAGPIISPTFVLSNPLFSETSVLTATFNAADAALQASAQLQAVPTPTSVPEPVSLALVGVGLVGLGAMRRRRKE